ncbi:MAG: PorT family protein [Bacteroidales bacterium]|nr:PorT family protein [Bacteroidales bacterium]
MKPQEEHSVEKTFRKLSDYEVQPPAEVWNAVQEALGRKKEKRLLWIRLSAAAAILAFAVLSGYYLGRQNQPVAGNLPQKNHQTTPEIATGSSAISSVTPPPAGENILPNARTNIKKSGIGPTAMENTADFNENQAGEENQMVYPEVSFPSLRRKEPAMAMASDWRLPGIREKLLLASLPSDEGFEVETEEKSQTEFSRHFVLDGRAGPVLAYRDVHGRTTGALADASGVSAKSQEQPLTTYAGTVQLHYQISKRISIGTGLGYSGMGLQWKESFSPSEYSLNGADMLQNKESVAFYNSNFATGNSLGNIPSLEGLASNPLASAAPAERSLSELQFIQQLGYVEIPFIVKYIVIDRKLGFSFSTGIINHILVRNSVYMNSDGGKTDLGSTEGIRAWNYSGTAALGIDYRLTRNLQMSIEPAFKYYLNPSNTTGSFSTHLFSFGIYSGLSYLF